jgi:hypothetical protein
VYGKVKKLQLSYIFLNKSLNSNNQGGEKIAANNNGVALI